MDIIHSPNLNTFLLLLDFLRICDICFLKLYYKISEK